MPVLFFGRIDGIYRRQRVITPSLDLGVLAFEGSEDQPSPLMQKEEKKKEKSNFRVVNFFLSVAFFIFLLTVEQTWAQFNAVIAEQKERILYLKISSKALASIALIFEIWACIVLI